MVDREFVFVDGEGLNRADGSHDYVLLAASDGSYVEQYEPGGLTTQDCFEYLLELADAHPGAIFCIFGGSYDFQMMLAEMAPPWRYAAERRQWDRMRRDQYVTIRARGRVYRVQAIMRHSLYVANGHYVRAEHDGNTWIKDRSVRVWDVLGWFQSTFVDALDHYRIGTLAERALIRDMKEGRATFKPHERAKIRRYCMAECKAGVELMAAIADTLDEEGIVPARWDGAGAGAAALMRKHKADRFIARPESKELNAAIMRAYFGGRVQQFVSGVVPGPTYTYDLSSAYPREIERLPSLHGRWQCEQRAGNIIPKRYAAGDMDTSIYHVRWSCPEGTRLTPFPFRHARAIWWPLEGEGWYWGEEVRAALECIIGRYEIHEAYHFAPESFEGKALYKKPFDWYADLCARRAQLKRGGFPGERVLKLIANAGYGKFVQAQQPSQKRLPSFQSYIWGGLVTAAVRAKMLRAAALAPGELVGIMTDGLFSVRPRMAELNDDAWSTEAIEPGLCVIQPGVMVSPRMHYVRSRGFSRAAITYSEAVDAWERNRFEGAVSVRERHFITADWAAFTGHPEHWRRWMEFDRELSFATIPRQWPRPDYFSNPADSLAPSHLEPLYPLARVDSQSMSEPYNPRDREPPTEDSEYEKMCMMGPEPAIDSGAAGVGVYRDHHR